MRISTQAKRIIVLLVAAAAMAPAAAVAGAPLSSRSDVGQAPNVPPAQCPCNVGLPAGPVDVTLRRTVSWPSASRCPCNVGLPDGPVVTPFVPASTTVSTPGTTNSSSGSRCPCNIGLPDGPVVTPVVLAATTVDPSSAARRA